MNHDERDDQEERSPVWPGVLARSICPVGFLSALLLLVLLPVAGASCDQDTGGPVHLCYTGAQLISGTPSVDMSNIALGSAQETAEVRGFLVTTVEPPGVVRVLAALVAIVLAVGALSAVVRRPRRRATVAAVTAGVGAVLLVATEIVAVVGLSRGVGDVVRLFAASDVLAGHKPDVGDVVGTGAGFWLALTVLAAIAVFSISALARLWSAAVEQEMRTPGDDLAPRFG